LMPALGLEKMVHVDGAATAAGVSAKLARAIATRLARTEKRRPRAGRMATFKPRRRSIKVPRLHLGPDQKSRLPPPAPPPRI
jgi:hypothetical protein